ncbi:single-stranded-DNA-specific exonuclease RecJ [Pseudanabaena sp. lw0831]|uniref:DHHA1 domain-containing protein n=1 Tax=Pseudanabaena sp. lw0831 TaxID=1357935 RepID=UPI0019159575|nr:DHHA1 domain-containing protein [Pseudanabaena sp. lw0831]GBO56877.1 single-stranded-DNA-specific exonuclease RecJ [Pseudanabaena sp. lw0831]
MEIKSANFSFLREHDPQLVNLAARAEQYFHSDSNTCILKLRQFAERLAQHIADETGHYQAQDEAQVELLRRLKAEGVISREVAELFHSIRIGGNNAAHKGKDDRHEALTLLKNARELGIWFHCTFSNDRNFRAGAFVPPAVPIDATAELIAEIERLQGIANDSQSAAERSRLEAEQKEIALKSAEEKARQAEAEKQRLTQMVIEKEQQLAQQSTNQTVTPQQTAEILKRSKISAKNIDLDEDQTRQISVQKSRDQSWEINPSSKREKALTPTSPKEGEERKRAGWHHGVIGIVASRLVERYGAPVFIGSYEDAHDDSEEAATVRFSVRGIPEFHVFEAIEYEPIKSIRNKGGGHKAAGGFTLPAANLEQLRQGLREFADRENILPSHISPLINIDVRIDLSDVSMTLLQECDRMQPCGLGNPDPVFYSQNVRVLSQQTRGRDKVKHLSLELDTGNGKIKAIAWRWGEYCPVPDYVDIAYKLRANQWQDTTSVELEIVGIREATGTTMESSQNAPKQLQLQYNPAPVITKFPQWQKLSEAPRPLPRPLLLYGCDRPADKFQGDVDCDRPNRDRDYHAIVLWTMPPSFTHLQWLIAIAKPDYIYLGSHIPSVPSIDQFLAQVQSLDLENIEKLNLLDISQQWWISPSAIVSALRELNYTCDFPPTLPLDGELLRMQKWYGIAIGKLEAILADQK